MRLMGCDVNIETCRKIEENPKRFIYSRSSLARCTRSVFLTIRPHRRCLPSPSNTPDSRSPSYIFSTQIKFENYFYAFVYLEQLRYSWLVPISIPMV